jgi:hypothetical protein
MANPLRDEDKIYERIKKENITIHPLVWELISHHIRNDIYLISLAIDSLRTQPLWLLKCTSFLMKFLYRASFQRGKAADLIGVCDSSLKGIKRVDEFLTKLKKTTYKPEAESGSEV